MKKKKPVLGGVETLSEKEKKNFSLPHYVFKSFQKFSKFFRVVKK